MTSHMNQEHSFIPTVRQNSLRDTHCCTYETIIMQNYVQFKNHNRSQEADLSQRLELLRYCTIKQFKSLLESDLMRHGYSKSYKEAHYNDEDNAIFI